MSLFGVRRRRRRGTGDHLWQQRQVSAHRIEVHGK
jgi:hypothetical protein